MRGRGGRAGLTGALVVYVPTFAFFALVTWAVQDGLPLTIGGEPVTLRLADLAQEATVVADAPVYAGGLELLGGILLCAAAAALLVSTLGLHRGPLRSALRDVGLFTAVFGLDDLFQLHEAVVPGLLGVPEPIVLALYAIAAMYLALRHRAVLVQRADLVLVVALGGFATSVLIDVVDPSLRWHAWTENVPKYVGIVGWSTFAVGWAGAVLRTLRSPAGPPSSGGARRAGD